MKYSRLSTGKQTDIQRIAEEAETKFGISPVDSMPYKVLFFFLNFLLEICNFLHLLLVFYNVMIYTLLSRSVLTAVALMRAILSKSQ